MTAADKEELYTEYRGRVLSYIRARVNNSEDAEDICSEVFEKALRAYDRFDDEKASVGTWIYSITRNTVIDYYRRTRRTDEIPEDLAADDLPEDSVLSAETLEELAAALERLPEDLVDVIVMHYYDRLPLTEIAARMDISYGAVKLRHRKALAMLKMLMRA